MSLLPGLCNIVLQRYPVPNGLETRGLLLLAVRVAASCNKALSLGIAL
jgi:hypothetical protein